MHVFNHFLRLKKLIAVTNFQQWFVKMYAQCQALLEVPIKAGKDILDKIESKIQCNK